MKWLVEEAEQLSNRTGEHRAKFSLQAAELSKEAAELKRNKIVIILGSFNRHRESKTQRGKSGIRTKNCFKIEREQARDRRELSESNHLTPARSCPATQFRLRRGSERWKQMPTAWGKTVYRPKDKTL